MKALDTSSLANNAASLKDWVVKYRVILFITIAASVIGYMIISIGAMSIVEPSQAQKDEAKKSVQVVEINETTIKTIKQLKSRDISIEALFKAGRYDPFND